MVFDFEMSAEGPSASGGAGVERSRVPSAGPFFPSLMLAMSDCDSLVEHNFRSRSLLPPRSFGRTVGIVRKKTRERIGSEEGWKLVFPAISLADRSAILLMNHLLGI